MKTPTFLLQTVILIGSIGGGLIVGLATSMLGYWLPGGHDLYAWIGTAVWLSAAILFRAYAYLYFVLFPKHLRYSPEHRNKVAVEGFRLPAVFGLIAGGVTSASGASTMGLILAAVCWGAVGALFGWDLRRRERDLACQRNSQLSHQE